MTALLNLLFPPNCLFCKEPSATRYLCPACWDLSQLPDPASRCRHCFEELTHKTDLCLECRSSHKQPYSQAYVFDALSPAACLPLELSRALAAFAYLLFIQLDWPDPPCLIPLPDAASLAIASRLASLLKCPISRALDPNLAYRPSNIEEGQELLLFSAKNDPETLQSALDGVFLAAPHKIRTLSLIGPDTYEG